MEATARYEYLGNSNASLELVLTIPVSWGTFDGSARREGAFRMPFCSTTITKTFKPRIPLGKNVPHWCSTAERQRMQWKNPLSCTVTHALQALPQKFSIESSGLQCKEEMCQKYLEAITSFLLIIFFISVFISVLMSMICYSGCIPLLLMGMSVFYFTKNVFLSSSPSFHPNFWRCMVCS